MIRSKVLLFLMIVGIPAIPVLSESAEHFYKLGDRAEKKNDYDAAFEAFRQAHEKNPTDPKIMASYLRLRFFAGGQHIEAGVKLRDAGKLQDALAEFRHATEIDGSNFAAMQEVRRTADLIQKQNIEKETASQPRKSVFSLENEASHAAGPVRLDIKNNVPVTLHLTTTSDVVYKTIAKLAGVNVLIDPDYKPQKVSFELKDVSVREALDMFAMQSKTFWRPLSANTILVSADSSTKRKEYEQNVMKTFYLRNAATPSDLQQAAGTLKGILDISHIQVTPEQRSLTLRGTPDQMVLAAKLLQDIDKPKAEVMIEVAVMEVTKGKLRTLGTVPPTSTTITVAPSGNASSSSSSSISLTSLTGLTSNDISISPISASFTALMSDSNTKVIQKPQIRAMDADKASLKIGDRIPIATGSYQSGITSGVNTQFQYIDVGVNIDITPYVHSTNDVTLKMSLEISSVTGEQTIDGVTEPTIGQRRIEHEARLKDGEVNLIAGILNDTESKSLSGYPWLAQIPILKYLFAQETKQRTQSEIVFAITPHIIRAPEITDDNLKMIDLGSASSVTYRRDDAKPDSEKPSSAPNSEQPADKPVQAPPAVKTPPPANVQPNAQSNIQKDPRIKPALNARPAPVVPAGPVRPALGAI
jgi:general secretion pathway protein D